MKNNICFRLSFLVISLLIICSYIMGCNGGAGATGTLIVRYRIGSGSKNCEEVKIESFRLYLYSGNAISLEHPFDCVPNNQEIILRDIPEGEYSIRIEGINKDGDITYEGSLERIEVIGNIDNGPYTVILEQVDPSIQIWVDFEGTGGCGRFGVKNIKVVLYYEGVNRVYDQTFNCEEVFNTGILIEDRIIAGKYDLRIRGVDSSGKYTYYYDKDDIKVEAGSRKIIEAILKSCPTSGCEEP